MGERKSKFDEYDEVFNLLDAERWDTPSVCFVCGDDFSFREDTFRFSLYRPADAAAGDRPYSDAVQLHLDCAEDFLNDPLSYAENDE